MKAIRVHAFGGPHVMAIEDVDLPPPGRGEVRVRFHAAGVNYIDTYFREGAYKPPSMPFIPGAEGTGEIVEVGETVESLAKGDRVAFVGSLGCYAEEANLPANRLVPLPDAISYEKGAAMMLKGLTAQYLLHQTHKLKRGDVILVHAAAGGVGLILCQWARHIGARVIGTAGSAEKADLARKAGADEVILYREEDFPARVKSLTDGKMCDVVYDGVGQATFPGSLDCLRPNGLFVSFGSASGKIAAFDIGILASKGSLYAIRPTLATYTADPKNLRAMAADLMKAVSDGVVEITVHDVAPLDQAAAVHEALQARATTGSVVLKP